MSVKEHISPVAEDQNSEDKPRSQNLDTSDEMKKELNSGCNSSSNEESAKNLKTRPKLTCPKCGETSDGVNNFLGHLQLHSGKRKCCADCRRDFPNTVAYKFHKESNLCRPSRSGKINKCKFCGRKFSKLNPYKKHVNAHKKNQCTVCCQNFSRRKHLVLHAQNVHQLELVKKPVFR